MKSGFIIMALMVFFTFMITKSVQTGFLWHVLKDRIGLHEAYAPIAQAQRDLIHLGSAEGQATYFIVGTPEFVEQVREHTQSGLISCPVSYLDLIDIEPCLKIHDSLASQTQLVIQFQAHYFSNLTAIGLRPEFWPVQKPSDQGSFFNKETLRRFFQMISLAASAPWKSPELLEPSPSDHGITKASEGLITVSFHDEDLSYYKSQFEDLKTALIRKPNVVIWIAEHDNFHPEKYPEFYSLYLRQIKKIERLLPNSQWMEWNDLSPFKAKAL